MSGRLRELRENRRISQEALGRELGTSQQNLSRYELDINAIPADMLIRFATYYNVSTDYILGISNEKRNQEGKVRIDKTIEENFDFLDLYRGLNEDHREILWHLAADLKRMEEKEPIKRKLR